MFNIIPAFKQKTGAEKTNVVILTDGESNHIGRHRMIYRHTCEPFLEWVKFPYGAMLRDRKLGTTYDLFADDGPAFDSVSAA